MPLKRIAKFSILAVSIIICLLIGAYFYVFFVYLPRHFQQEVLPELMREAGITGFSGKVKSAGVFGANLGELCIGNPENPTLKVRSVMIRYRFQNIFMPRRPDITNLDLNGLELICRIKGKKLEVNNIDIEKFLEQLAKHFTGNHKDAIGSWGKAKLKVTGGLMNLDWNGTKMLLPFELTFNPAQQNWEVFTADLKFSWREHPIDAELLVDLNNKTTEIKFNAQTETAKLLFLLSKQGVDLPGLELSGTADLEGNIVLAFNPWKVKKLTVSGTSRSCEIHYGALILKNNKHPSGLNIPLEISVSSTGDGYLWKLKNGLVKQPLAVFIDELSCLVYENEQKALQFNGIFEFDLTRLELFKYYNIRNESKTNLVREISGRYNRITNNWQLETAKEGRYARKNPMKPLITYFDTKFFADISEFGFKGRGCGRNGKLVMDMGVSELSATGRKNAFFCNDLKLNSEFELIPAANGKMRIKKNYFKINAPEFSCSSLERQLKVSDFSVNGSSSYEGFEMNGFEFSADAKTVSFKQDIDIVAGNECNITLDGILHRNKKTWELALNTFAGQLYGKFMNKDFSLTNARTKNFLSLYVPLFKWTGTPNCNIRFNCDNWKYGDEDKYFDISGICLGTEMAVDKNMTLVRKTFSGKIRKIKAEYQNFSTSVSKLELAGKFDPEDKSEKKEADKEPDREPDMDFLGHVEASSMYVKHNDIKYSGESVALNLTGKTFNKFLCPEVFQAGLTTPELTVTRDKEKVQIDGISLKTESIFKNEANGYNWLDSLAKINLGIVYEKLSGIWQNVNILTKKADIKFNADTDFKDLSILSLKKTNAGIKILNLVMYNDLWKLAGSKAELNFSGDVDREKLVLNPDLKLDNFYISTHDINFRVPEISVKSNYADGALAGIADCENAVISKSNFGLSFEQIALRLPFGKNAQEGEMSVGKIMLRKQNLGKLNAELKFGDEDLRIKANHFSEIFPDASLFFSGKVKLSPAAEWEGDFTVPEFKMKNALSIETLFEGLKNIGYTGKARMEGHLSGNLTEVKSSGMVALDQGHLYLGAWELKGLKTYCNFDDLFNLKSARQQRLFCRSVRNDSIKFSNAAMEYHLQGLKELNVERLSCKWFGGLLTSLVPFTLTGKKSNPEKVDFLAARVTLSPFLDYLGLKGFASDAFVGGIIPFVLKDDNVYISDAALATKISQMGFLRLGDGWSKFIDADDDESEASRKKFTEAALRRFNYNWIRLNVTTSPEMSILELSIDGHPSAAVPFKYNSEKAVFEPVPPGDPGINGDMVIETKFIIPKTKEVAK